MWWTILAKLSMIWCIIVLCFIPLCAIGWKTEKGNYQSSYRELYDSLNCNSTRNVYNCTNCLSIQNCAWCLPTDNGNLAYCTDFNVLCRGSFNTYSNNVVCNAKPSISNVSVTLMIIFFTACCCLCLSTLCYCGIRSYVKTRTRVHLVSAGAIEEAQVQWSPYSYDTTINQTVRTNPGYSSDTTTPTTAVAVECVEWNACHEDRLSIPLGYQTNYNGTEPDNCNHAISVPISTPVSLGLSAANYRLPTSIGTTPQHAHRLD
jgi:hypothetical protein